MNIADSPRDDQDVWRTIRQEVVPVPGPPLALLVDETGWLKQGKHSVGVAHQYCGAVGTQANCQVSVGVAVTDDQIAAPVAGQLYLPKSWTDDPVRCEAAGVPPEIKFQTKPDIALSLIKQVLDDGVAPAPVSTYRPGLNQCDSGRAENTGDLLRISLPAAPNPCSARR